MTISIGVACALPKIGERPGSTLHAALARLARARAQGADQICVDDVTPARSRVDVPSAPSATHAERLLIVDDDALSIEVLSELLRGAGYRVETLGDSSAAVAEVQARRPDLVLLDLLMPPPDGFEICRQLKATPNTAEIPVVFLSIVDDPLQKSRAFEVGGADYVGKTFHQEEVLARVRHQLAIRHLQREMREANERLLQASKLKATFAAMLMHDLRSPLGVAQATIDMLVQKMGGLDTELLELAEVAGGGLKNTVALINELLEVYRSEQVQVAPLRERIDLDGVLRRVVAEARLEARSRQVALELVLSGPLAALGDRIRLERAFGNLIGNALKHTRAGGQVTVDARAIAGAAGPALRVEVRDTGTGIPEGEIPYIFDLYRQAETGRHGGMGLGLAIVKRILDAHDASIAVESKLGVGSTFSVELSAV